VLSEKHAAGALKDAELELRGACSVVAQTPTWDFNLRRGRLGDGDLSVIISRIRCAFADGSEKSVLKKFTNQGPAVTDATRSCTRIGAIWHGSHPDT
jgi:hypothetical protein